LPVVTRQSPKKKATKKKASSGSAWDRISDISFEDEGLKMLLYGRSASGKTTFWSSFPGPILAIIASGGRNPGELRSVNTPALRKKIKTINIDNSLEIKDLCEQQAETGRFATVVLDHSTGLQDKVLGEILGVDEIPVQKSWGLASQQQYGQCTAQCKELFRMLLNLSCNVVIVAQERESVPDGDTADLLLPYVGAALTPSLAGWLNPACDYICQTFKRAEMVEKEVKIAGKTKIKTSRSGSVEFCLRTGPDDIYTTKFRMPKGTELPELIVDPDYDKLMEIINHSG